MKNVSYEWMVLLKVIINSLGLDEYYMIFIWTQILFLPIQRKFFNPNFISKKNVYWKIVKKNKSIFS